MLWAFSKYQNWRATDRKNTRKALIRDLVETGRLSASEVTPEYLRQFGLEELDLKDLREKELA